MSVFAFTPLRFAALLVVSVGVSLSTANRPAASIPSSQAEGSTPYRVAGAVGQDNGSLTSNLYLRAGYTPTSQMRAADRHGIVSMPQGPPPMLHHFYPPLAR